MLGFLLRPQQMGLFETPIHKLIWVYVLYAGIHLIVDYESHRLLAIRDSSMAYYSLYYITAFSLFHDSKVVETFERIVKIAGILAVCSMAYDATGTELVVVGFAPHLDAYIPISIGVILYCLIIGIEKRKMHYVMMACIIILLVVASSKTAALVALAAVIFCAIIFGGINKLIMPAVMLLLIGLVALSAMMFIDTDSVMDLLTGGEVAETFGIQGGEFVGFSGTSAWRLLWWSVIWQDTMQISPFWGQGFGADITGPFLETWLGPGYGDATGYARYPHNILITNLGRLGLVGFVFFLILFIAIASFLIKFCRRYFASPMRRDSDLICFGIVLAGMVNGVLQATYEIPHSAITHWVCLAYLAVRYYRPDESLKIADSTMSDIGPEEAL
jgi:O-antigen ligase